MIIYLNFSYFQFHKGAIETAFEGVADALDGTFNSIKVRLKRGVRQGVLRVHGPFNSIKVRLKLQDQK